MLCRTSGATKPEQEHDASPRSLLCRTSGVLVEDLIPLSQITTPADEVSPVDEVTEVVVASGDDHVNSLGAMSLLLASNTTPQLVL